MSDYSSLTTEQASLLEARQTMFAYRHGRSPDPDELAAMTAAVQADPPASEEATADDQPTAGDEAFAALSAEREAARIVAVHDGRAPGATRDVEDEVGRVLAAHRGEAVAESVRAPADIRVRSAASSPRSTPSPATRSRSGAVTRTKRVVNPDGSTTVFPFEYSDGRSP